ncbi:MAG: glycoside hydrolase N-terminal domain-containing protein [Firmicutes bacterium]|nr:glycoside hydrolase N-terminal domain-containing protein [Bacillota bacterium]
MNHSYDQDSFLRTYNEILPQSEDPGSRAWRDGMISGNGEIGYITSGSPYGDTYILQHMYFNFPADQPRHIPEELPSQLKDARKHVMNFDKNWDITDKDGNLYSSGYYYAHHPGPQLRLTLPAGPMQHYERCTRYETAETIVTCDHWQRRAFTSRPDNVIIIQMRADKDTLPDVTLSFDSIQEMCKAYDKYGPVTQQKPHMQFTADAITFTCRYPYFAQSELKDGGYGCAIRILTKGGSSQPQEECLHITDARQITLVVALDRTFHMDEKFTKDLYQRVDRVIAQYTTEEGAFSYDLALAASAAIHGQEWRKTTFHLSGDEEYAHYDNLELITLQQQTPDRLNHELLRRIYHHSRYAMLCCGGSSAPRLHALWTGEWNPGWRGIYTLDANVNLQVSAMNTSQLPTMAQGYITFFLRHSPDFMANAHMSYGMHDAIQISVNADADRAMHIEYRNAYPFQYWNAGASWCLLPIFEYWQCYGSCPILINDYMRFDQLRPVLGINDGGLSDDEFAALSQRGWLDLAADILLPLLTKMANFWEQLVSPQYYMNSADEACYDPDKKHLAAGEKYLILPSYSPENTSLGYNNALHMNAVMDISAARDGLTMIIQLEKALKRPGYELAVARWEKLLANLPEYQLDDTGALKEWALEAYPENNDHRHVSHLYPAWPAYETTDNPNLRQAAIRALQNRDKYNIHDDTAGHGWVHRGLVEARLKHADGVEYVLKKLLSSQILYASLMTDHDTTRRKDTYCTDTAFSLVSIINESLVYSDAYRIQLLPALPQSWTSGHVRGLMTRTCVEIQDLRWNTNCIQVTLRSLKDHNHFILDCGDQQLEVTMEKGETRQWQFRWR